MLGFNRLYADTATQVDRQIETLLDRKLLTADGERLYLKENHHYEQAAAVELGKRLSAIDLPVPPERLAAALAAAEVFLPSPPDEDQRSAVRT